MKSKRAGRAEADPRAMVVALREALGIDADADKAAALLEAYRRACEVPPGEAPATAAGALGRIVGRSRALTDVLGKLGRIARSGATVLILGENGTGKELIARAVHDLSSRRSGPFVSQNCSAIAETLLESSLFGHIRGAFTGAVEDRRGLFEAADGGTLFLDEIGEMSAGLQSRLLRVIEDSTIVPVGSIEGRRVDVRVVAATNRDLASMIRDGAFREDLYHRLSVLTVEVPPLRERRDDVPALVEHFFEKLSARYGGRKRPSDGCLARLCAYSWPGNVRELQHELERLWILSGSDEVAGEEHLSPEIAMATGDRRARGGPVRGLRGRVEALERQQIADALRRTSGNRTRAAELLGVSRRNLIRKIAKMGIRE